MYHITLAVVTAVVSSPKTTNASGSNLWQWLQNNAAVIVAIITAVASIVTVRMTAVYNRTTLIELQKRQHEQEVRMKEEKTPSEVKSGKNKEIVTRYIRYQEGVWKDGQVSTAIGERLSVDTEYVPVKVLNMSQQNFIPIGTNAQQKSRIFDPSLLMKTTQMLRERSIREGNAIDLLQVVLQPGVLGKHHIVRGEIGVGKTLALRYIAYAVWIHEKRFVAGNIFIDEKTPLPIYVALKDFANSQYDNLFDYIVDACYKSINGGESITLFDVKDLLHTKLEEGTVILLLDGFDETFIGDDDNERKASSDRVYNAIDTIANTRHSQNSVIITTRHDIPGIGLQGFMKYHMPDFCLDTVYNFVVKWLKSHNEEDFLEDLWGMLRCNPRLQSLVTRQLLLWFTANTYLKAQSRDERDLASSYQLATLCDKSINLLLNDWNSEKNLLDNRHDRNKKRVILSGIVILLKRVTQRSKKPLLVHYNKSSETIKLRLLEEIAWESHRADEYQMSKSKVLEIISVCVPANLHTKFIKRLSHWAQQKPDLFKPIISHGLELKKQEEEAHKQILQEIGLHSGLLQEHYEAGNVSYSFPGLLLQEFFAARYAKRLHNAAKLLQNYNHPWWKQVIIFYVHMIDATDAKSFLETLLTPAYSDDFYTNLLLAGCCLAACRDRDKENYRDVYHTIVQQLVEELLNTSCLLLRQQIVFVLNKIESDTRRLLQDLRTFIQLAPVAPTAPAPAPNATPAQGTVSTPAIPAPRISCSDLFNQLSDPLPPIPYSFLPLIISLPYSDFLEDIKNNASSPYLDTIPKKDRRAFFFKSLLYATSDNQNLIRIIDALASQVEPAVATSLFEHLVTTIQNLTTLHPGPPDDLITLSCHIAYALKSYGDSSQVNINQLVTWIEDTNIDIHIRCSLVKTLYAWSDLFYGQITPALLNIFTKDNLDDYLRWSLAIVLVSITSNMPYNPPLRRNIGWDKFQDPTIKEWSKKLKQQRDIDIPWLSATIATVQSEQKRHVIDTLAVLLTNEQFLNNLAQDAHWKHLSDDLYIARRIVWERNKCGESTL